MYGDYGTVEYGMESLTCGFRGHPRLEYNTSTVSRQALGEVEWLAW